MISAAAGGQGKEKEHSAEKSGEGAGASAGVSAGSSRVSVENQRNRSPGILLGFARRPTFQEASQVFFVHQYWPVDAKLSRYRLSCSMSGSR